MHRITQSILYTVLGIALITTGCGKKEDSSGTNQAAEEKKILTITLENGERVDIDANTFGVGKLPEASFIAYEYEEDERHLVDPMGQPFVQDVYRHQLLAETFMPIEELITLFFPYAPHIINRRKVNVYDSYVRLVSTKDAKTMRELDSPYIIIDMRLVFPPAEKKEPASEVIPPVEQSIVPGSEQDQCMALKNQLEGLQKQFDSGKLSIPERRRVEGQILMLKQAIDDLETRINQSTRPAATAKTVDNAVLVEKKRPKVKLKIVSFNKRS